MRLVHHATNEISSRKKLISKQCDRR